MPVAGVLVLAASLVVLAAPGARAQVVPNFAGAGPAPTIGGGPKVPGQQQQRPLPPALPGAKSDASRVAPPTKLPSEMNPTDALFDAINRGDIASARDAISRGADLDGHNILGMTPIELSIDLGRNDISFLLLSMRGADSGPRGPEQEAQAGPPPKPVHETRRQSVTVKVAAPPPPRSARLFSGDGGAPVPSAGFLGFDTSGKD